jgi:hypothetical protein
MKALMLAAFAALSLGCGVANAATSTTNTMNHKPNYYNWLAGGD